MGCMSAYAFAQFLESNTVAFNRLQCTKENGSKEIISILCNYRPSLSASLFSCASPFSAALAGFAPDSSSKILGFRGHASTRYLSPPICRSCSAGPLAELAPRQRFDSQLSSSKARAARRLLVARTPVFSRVTRVANSIRSPPGRSAAQLAPIVIPAPVALASSIQGAFRRPDCPGSSSLARWFGTPPLVQARVLTCASSRRLLLFSSFSICHVASLVGLFFPLKCLFVRERMVGLLPASCKCPIPSSKLAFS